MDFFYAACLLGIHHLTLWQRAAVPVRSLDCGYDPRYHPLPLRVCVHPPISRWQRQGRQADCVKGVSALWIDSLYHRGRQERVLLPGTLWMGRRTGISDRHLPGRAGYLSETDGSVRYSAGKRSLELPLLVKAFSCTESILGGANGTMTGYLQYSFT